MQGSRYHRHIGTDSPSHSGYRMWAALDLLSAIALAWAWAVKRFAVKGVRQQQKVGETRGPQKGDYDHDCSDLEKIPLYFQTLRCKARDRTAAERQERTTSEGTQGKGQWPQVLRIPYFALLPSVRIQVKYSGMMEGPVARQPSHQSLPLSLARTVAALPVRDCAAAT
ncbi:hypothetical protein BDZ91DRAFT_760511 [Kalaharituber pfeilii]|nr:hypothetical protein BDZ91DRAFT_760511 [Kalaharituber pfeilii]